MAPVRVDDRSGYQNLFNDKPGMAKNSDGSHDVYFDPKAPKGREDN
jgi:hypothetical protein